ncbi:hypothetical protein [Paenibacillus chitinolyticus]|uniref:hypothetical protein n=1 Tax=Paenibacillus chitinolyticus TaxID=79263 RepID=UPI003D052770
MGAAGSVVNSAYFKQKLAGELSAGNHKTYCLSAARFSPAANALLTGYRSLDIPLNAGAAG